MPQHQVDLIAAELQRLFGYGLMGTDRNTSGWQGKSCPFRRACWAWK